MRVVLVALASLLCESHCRRHYTTSEHTKGFAHEENEVLASDSLFSPVAASSHLSSLQALSAFLLASSSPAMRAQSQRQVQKSSSRFASALCEDGRLPNVLFVLGGPGAGKGTQCEKVVEQCSSWAHISAGDCLREERADPNSKEGEMINSYIKEGKLVPSSVVVKLIQKAMAAKMQEGKSCVLVDGFPRSNENMEVWNSQVKDSADIKGVLFFDVSEEEMEKRLIKRGETSGRADDNIETIRKRFNTYKEETLPVLECFKAEGKVFCVDSGRDVDAVWESTKQIIQQVEGTATVAA